MEREGSRKGVPAKGSVWEKRMRMDEVKGGVKVFEEAGERRPSPYNLRLPRGPPDGDRKKRKNWNSPNPDPTPIDAAIAVLVNDIEMETERKSFEDKEMDIDLAGKKEFSDEVKESPPQADISENGEGFHDAVVEAEYRMQRIVDLVMWREIPRSGFVFGMGSFFLLSSSYTRSLNFSLISAASYLGLIYLAKIFFFNSNRKETRESDKEDDGKLFGEEDAIRLIKPLLPFVNEIIFNLRALFSGDPATTMKLAAFLFFLARCGGAVTPWTMAKMGFFGLFTIPKICSSYSLQLARIGKFWVERGKDAWGTCQHKKALAVTVFALVWNVLSAVSRVWAVFMLLVAVRLYRQREADCGGGRGEEEAALRS